MNHTSTEPHVDHESLVGLPRRRPHDLANLRHESRIELPRLEALECHQVIYHAASLGPGTWLLLLLLLDG